MKNILNILNKLELDITIKYTSHKVVLIIFILQLNLVSLVDPNLYVDIRCSTYRVYFI